MKILLIIIFLIFSGCGDNQKDTVKELKKELFKANNYLNNSAKDIFVLQDFDEINQKIDKINIILKDTKYKNIHNFEKVKKSISIKIELIKRIISYSAILNNSYNYIKLYKNFSKYKIINIRNINIDKELVLLQNIIPKTTT